MTVAASGERVGVDDPLQAREAGVEVGGDRRQRGVDHRDVEHQHRRGRADHGERPALGAGHDALRMRPRSVIWGGARRPRTPRARGRGGTGRAGASGQGGTCGGSLSGIAMFHTYKLRTTACQGFRWDGWFSGQLLSSGGSFFDPMHGDRGRRRADRWSGLEPRGHATRGTRVAGGLVPAAGRPDRGPIAARSRRGGHPRRWRRSSAARRDTRCAAQSRRRASPGRASV